MPLGMEVGLGPVDVVLDGHPVPLTEGAHSAAPFSAHCAVVRSAISAAAEHLLGLVRYQTIWLLAMAGAREVSHMFPVGWFMRVCRRVP